MEVEYSEIKNCCSPVDSNQRQRGSESGALSLSSAARHINFQLLRHIYENVALIAHSIALSLQYSYIFKIIIIC